MDFLVLNKISFILTLVYKSNGHNKVNFILSIIFGFNVCLLFLFYN